MTTRIIPASTVILARSSEHDDIEIYVQQRQSTMEYAAGMVVFPGGGVEPEDYPLQISVDPVTNQQAELLHTSVDALDGTREAALRELHEETGLDLKEHTHRLLPLDRWITPALPEFKRRYDATTFILDCASTLNPAHQTTEATSSFWASPRELLEQWGLGKIRLLPPTWWHLKQFSQYNSVDELVESAMNPGRPTVFKDWEADPADMHEYYARASVNGQPLTAL